MGRAKIDLHLHFDGALVLRSALDLAKGRGLVEPTCTLEEFKEQMSIPPTTRNLAEYLECFALPIAILQDEEALKESMAALVFELDRQGLAYAEIRFAPQQHTQKGLSQAQVVEAVLRGKARAEKQTAIRTNLILCMMMIGPASVNEEENLETLRVTKQFLNHGVVAADLAGDEEIAPLEEFAGLFKKAKEWEIPFVIHAGESGPAENVALAIELGAKRIGHGGHATKNPAVFKQVVDAKIPLELCPTSNLQCNSQPSYRQHAMIELFQKGAVVTINTDNPTLSNITLESEMEMAIKEMGFSEADLETMTQNAIQAAFLSEEEKQALRQRIGFPSDRSNFQ